MINETIEDNIEAYKQNKYDKEAFIGDDKRSIEIISTKIFNSIPKYLPFALVALAIHNWEIALTILYSDLEYSENLIKAINEIHFNFFNDAFKIIISTYLLLLFSPWFSNILKASAKLAESSVTNIHLELILKGELLKHNINTFDELVFEAKEYKEGSKRLEELNRNLIEQHGEMMQMLEKAEADYKELFQQVPDVQFENISKAPPPSHLKTD